MSGTSTLLELAPADNTWTLAVAPARPVGTIANPLTANASLSPISLENSRVEMT
jgi:hypothetical protein